MDISLIVSFATTMFLLLNPLGNAPIILSLLQDVEPKRRRWIITRELVYALILLLVFFMAGRPIMGWLHISGSTLNLAGGILLFLAAIGMVFPTLNVISGGPRQKVKSGEVFIVPVAVPLLAGPGAISIVMLKGSGSANMTEMIGYLISILIAWGITIVVLLCSQKIMPLLGEKGSVAIMRLMGMLLVLLSVEMFLGGLTDYVGNLLEFIFTRDEVKMLIQG